MKVILQETVEGLGHVGDLLDVSDGFARNYLLPRRKALEAGFDVHLPKPIDPNELVTTIVSIARHGGPANQ